MRDYIDENDKKNEIRLLFRHPSYKNKIIVVVEGDSDYKLFRKLISHERIKIESIDGKKQLIQVMKTLSVEFPEQILGICDADFDHLMGEAEDRKEYAVFVTDEHDIEIMMLFSPALHAFYDEYSSKENIDIIKELALKNILNASYYLGLIRWLNIEYHFNLNFKGMNYSQFIHADKLRIELNEDALIDALLNRSPKLSQGVNKESLLAVIEEFNEKSKCERQVCCGHDVTNIMALIYRQHWASVETNMSFQKIEMALRVGYPKSHFYKTRLFESLRAKLDLLDIHLIIPEAEEALAM